MARLRHVPGFDEFIKGFGKDSRLTIIHNFVPRGQNASYNLMMDPVCLGHFQRGNYAEINLRPVLQYYCCSHIVYCPFTCGDKNFLKLAIPPEIGRYINDYPCPFHDGGVSKPALANFGDSSDNRRFLKLT